MTLSRDLENLLAEQRPDLLRQLRGVIGGDSPASGGVNFAIEEKPLSALERGELARVQNELQSPNLSPARRGQLVTARLRLAGLTFSKTAGGYFTLS